MATIRVSGSKQVTPLGTSVISAPNGKIVLDSSSTFANGNLSVNEELLVRGDAKIVGKIEVSTPGKDETQVHILEDNTANVENPYGIPYDKNNIYGTTAQRTAGAVYVPGGVGIEKDLNVGGFIYGRVESAVTSTNLIISSTNVDKVFYPIFADGLSDNMLAGVKLYGDKEGENTGLYYNPYKGIFTVGQVQVKVPTPSTSTTTGALTVDGGVGIAGELHVDDIYTKVLSSINSKIQIAPDTGLTEVIGDIRVLGNKPIGTAPVVTNVLYVSIDGDDTNDGRAADASRACRTIGGALNSPYYAPGTQILVSAGHYLEDNPLRLKPYTSIRGSDIRTTFIEPINKTQDLFHLDSGCYLNYMTFLNGRSGLLEGPYTNDVNRGAYCTAFPPLTGDERIDLFQSPYVQNCTNQSGPWLKDGTMFLPNQTVQVPLAVGVGTWPANTTTIVIDVIDGEVVQGQHINSGQQNQGFFNARTLMLANKSFLQDQVVSFVDKTFNSNAFTYNTTACVRDVGLIVDSIGMDLLYNSNSESVFAGLQYWEQSGSSVPGEVTTTTNAIIFAKSLASGVLSEYPTAASTVSDRFDNVIDILNNGTAGVTDTIISNGLPSTNADTVAAYELLLNYKPEIQDATIEYINSNLTSPFVLTPTAATKCGRDTDLIIDSVIQDILFDGDSQSTFAGLQYWSQSVGYVGDISNELTTTTQAINYVKMLSESFAQGIEITSRYQFDVDPVTNLPPADTATANEIADRFDLLTNILTNGTVGVTDQIVPNSITPSTDSEKIKAFKILQANKEYFKAEAVAYVDDLTLGGPATFIFGPTESTKCARDTGLIVDAVVQDMLFGGSSQSTFAGLQYWSQSVGGYTGNIASELTMTISAIDYLSLLIQNVVQNKQISSGYQNVEQQVITTNSASETEALMLADKLSLITDILSNGTAGITDKIVTNGITASNSVNINRAYDLLFSNKNYLKAEVIAFVEANKPSGFGYDAATCARDVGYIVDSVGFDLLYGGNKQSIQSGVYYYGYDSTSVLANTGTNETPQTVAAYNYIKTLLNDVARGVAVSAPKQTAVSQVLGTGGTTTEATLAANKVQLMIDIIQSGPLVAGSKTPIGQTSTTDINVDNAARLIYANKEFIKAEVIEFVKTTNNITYMYDRVKCARDVGYIIDSISFDLLYGGNKQTIQSAVYYYGYSNNSVFNATGSNETPQAIAAYNYIKALLPSIVKNVPIATTYQSAVTQVFGASGSNIEAQLAVKKIENIVKIIEQGPSAAVSKTAIKVVPTSSVDAVNSANLLLQNKDFIKAEVIAYVGTLTNFVYDQEKCRRDISYIVDSVAFDLLHGGNKQSIKSGVYYYNYINNTILDNIDGIDETPQVLAAYNFIKSIIKDIVTATPISKLNSVGIDQNISGTPATVFEGQELQDRIDLITDILRNGPSVVTEKLPINLVMNTNGLSLNAYNLLQSNRAFIQAEVIEYINQNFNSFPYAKEYCRRDVGILVENVAYDAAFGGNQKSVEAGLAYYNGAASKIAGQESQTVAAIDYLNKLCQDVIRNIRTDRLVNSSNTIVQSVNTALDGGEIASESITSLFNIITDIISNGPDVVPDQYASTGPDAAFVSAEVLLQANKQFIQENTVNYVNWNLTQKQFPYSKIKCKRDTRLIVDAVALDLLYPTTHHSQSTFAGLQYWSSTNYTGDINNELNQTLDAISYLRTMSAKILQNITAETDAILGINRYSTGTQITNIEPATSIEVSAVSASMGTIIDILKNGNAGWTDKIVTNGNPSSLISIKNAIALLQENKTYLANEVTAYISYAYPSFNYNVDACKTDIGNILDCVCFDLLHGGNKQTIQAGLSYYGVGNSGVVIEGQSVQSVAAFNRIKGIVPDILLNRPVVVSSGTTEVQVINLPSATTDEVTEIINSLNTITNIINLGLPAAQQPSPISLLRNPSENAKNAYDILKANTAFIVDEVIHYIDNTYNAGAFEYNEELCYRDLGLIVDAVSQDILLGGNQKTIECGLAYWNAGYNYVAGQETTTTMAINFAKNLSLEVIANNPVTPVTGTNAVQVINPFYQYGGDYMPQEAVRRNFGIISNIVQNGPEYAPPAYAGGGLFSLTGLNGSSVNISPTVTSVKQRDDGKYVIGLSTATIGFGSNSTLYFGDITTYPIQDEKVPEKWAMRRVDPIGAMGGSLVDGKVISSRSPIQSFVYDAFTQVSQGGRGIHITNDGYAQLVSVFTIFCSVGVQVDNGGIASILNSNNNFGDLCLVAKGFGSRKFTGHIYNPVYKAYPESPVNQEGAEFIADSEQLDQYYPNGYWPRGGQVRVFLPDLDDRPHISLIMEVVPPAGHLNEQQLPGFLNAAPSLATIPAGSITISNIDTTGIVIGNSIRIRDQFGNEYDANPYLHDADGNPVNAQGQILTNPDDYIENPDYGVYYVQPDTVVTDIGYRSVTLSKSLPARKFVGEVGNDSYFDLYFAGNAYYTVLSSELSNNPTYNRKNQLIPIGANVLSTASTGWSVSQVVPHAETLRYLQTATIQVINNEAVDRLSTATEQNIDFLVSGGIQAQAFINVRFNDIVEILTANNATAAENVVPPRLRNKTGIVPNGSGSAITLIKRNIEFLADQVSTFSRDTYFSTYGLDADSLSYIESKCRRDVKIILQRLIYDLETGGNYNSVMSGLSYWNRSGTYHTVQMGENVRRPDLFPDGAEVNFYQRSYISASGYVFEYVGAGTNYGALPQVGRADPVQGKETIQISGGKVFFTSTDQNGDFRIGPGLVISQATGVLSGRTFTKSLFANMTPFILAIETGM